MQPDEYEAWYHTPRGVWIAKREFALMMRLMKPRPGQSLLDVGCGTGHFSRRFAAAGLRVTGLDADAAMLIYARSVGGGIGYVEATAEHLPLATASVDYSAAVASLCFVTQPARALAEMWRVARRGVLLGLLNRRSLLYRHKRGRGAYAGARWDTPAEVRGWSQGLSPPPSRVRIASAVLLPGASPSARLVEQLWPAGLNLGSFLAVSLQKSG